MGFIDYFMSNSSEILFLLVEHIKMTFISVFFAIIIGVPLGILISYVRKLDKPVMAIANVVQAVPSMALLGLAIPLLGIGVLPAVVMVIIYSLLPIIKNTYTGISSIDPQMEEAARGIGLTNWQILAKIKLPIALPVIMAGVRISAVTAVGLMTMAAFIGAGGLGYLVFSGIRTVNNYQILSGAIPACILALVVDYLMSVIEKLVTPVSLQTKNNKSKQEVLKERKKQKGVLGVTLVLIVVILVGSIVGSFKTDEDGIVLGAKDFTEQEVMAYLYGEMIEDNTGIPVTIKENLGGSQIAFQAIKNGEIDMYIDYTGTVFVSILKHKAIADAKEANDICKKDLDEQYNLYMFEPTVFNNTYTMAVRPDTAEKYGLKKISDLKKCDKDLVLGCTMEFLNRKDDGLPGIKQKYGLHFKDEMGIDSSPRFQAIENGKVDLIDAFQTDGLLKKYNLVILEDSDHYFPPYNGIPIIREDVFEKYPAIEEPVNRLSKLLTNETMQELNYQVDEGGRAPKDVAHEFLVKNNLIKK